MSRRIMVAVCSVLLVAGCSANEPNEPASFASMWATTPTTAQSALSLKPTTTAPAAKTTRSTTTRSTTATTRHTTTLTTTPTVEPDNDLARVTGVTDGDTIKVDIDGVNETIRVIGIDTPERGDCYYQQAASRMQSLVQSKTVRLAADPTQADRDVYGRLLRHVWTLDGLSVAQTLIAGGFGTEYTYDLPYQGQAQYRQSERDARAAGLGIWSSGCQAPPPEASAPPVQVPQTQCVIKGNINSKGEHIYHVPGQRYYDETQINESKGERWFCSESEAQNAGWRKSKV